MLDYSGMILIGEDTTMGLPAQLLASSATSLCVFLPEKALHIKLGACTVFRLTGATIEAAEPVCWMRQQLQF